MGSSDSTFAMRITHTDNFSNPHHLQAEQKKRKIWKLVLTGGPCGGKTTGQARLSTFFENLGWKVYRVPETATVLLGGGVNFAELPEYAQFEFQNTEVLFPGEPAADNDPDRELILRPGGGE